jgi:hypothetical protein
MDGNHRCRRPFQDRHAGSGSGRAPGPHIFCGCNTYAASINPKARSGSPTRSQPLRRDPPGLAERCGDGGRSGGVARVVATRTFTAAKHSAQVPAEGAGAARICPMKFCAVRGNAVAAVSVGVRAANHR